MKADTLTQQSQSVAPTHTHTKPVDRFLESLGKTGRDYIAYRKYPLLKGSPDHSEDRQDKVVSPVTLFNKFYSTIIQCSRVSTVGGHERGRGREEEEERGERGEREQTDLLRVAPF